MKLDSSLWCQISIDDWNRKAITGQLSKEYDMLIGKWSFGMNEDVNDLFHTRSDTKFQGRHNIFNYSNPEVDATLVNMKRLEQPIQQRTSTSCIVSYQKTPILVEVGYEVPLSSEVKDSNITPYYYFTDIDRWIV